MNVGQLPERVLEFARYLNGLVDRLDGSGGWCGVFWHRDPEGMRACLEGREVPPWDVVEALLQDVFAQYGERAAAQETVRARTLYEASLAAYDVRPGSRDALSDRLDVMLREQRYAAELRAELNLRIASAASREQAEAIRLDLAWAEDDHQRATARCAELRHRMDNVDRHALRVRARGASSFPPSGTGGGAGPVPGSRPTSVEPTGPRFPSDRVPSGHPESGTRPGGLAARPTGFEPGGIVELVSPPMDHSPGYDVQPTPTHHSPGYVVQPTPTHHSPGYDVQPAPTHHSPGRDPQPLSRPTPPMPLGDPRPGRPLTDSAPSGAQAHGPAATPAPAHDRTPPGAGGPSPAKRSKRRRRGGARFAGMAEADAAPMAVPETAPVLPAPPAQGGRTPRGARFAGAAEEPVRPRPTAEPEPPDEDARRLVAEIVASLARLRGEGRSGEAHALLVEAAYWPPARFPLLAAELHRSGLDADWATLLWEAASLPAGRLVAAADALTAAGRAPDGRQMLRQGATRPAPEIGAAVLDLADEGRGREIGALLDAYVRVRTPEEAARSAEADPERLVPLLLGAARGVSEECTWDLVHALRVAGLTV
ncbi:hypothetical protein [Streptomyces sp. NPDC005281]|uniref:hypothetical protein n=1 Tax=Streptomyces sp. NPDC005281 TaxID=3155712 RepID=UPI0033A70C36